MKKTIAILFIFMAIQYFLALVLLSRQHRKEIAGIRQRRTDKSEKLRKVNKSISANAKNMLPDSTAKRRIRLKTPKGKRTSNAKRPAQIRRQKPDIQVPPPKPPKPAIKARLAHLLKKLQIRNWRRRENVARELKKMVAQDPKLISLLIADLKKNFRRNQTQLIRLLGEIGRPALPMLIAELSNKDYAIRRVCIMAIGEMPGQAAPAIPQLIKMLERDHISGCQAAGALAKIGLPALPALLDVLKKGGQRSQTHAMSAIFHIGKRAQIAIPVLEKIAQDRKSNSNLKSLARTAIANIKGRKRIIKRSAAKIQWGHSRSKYYTYNNHKIDKELAKAKTPSTRARALIRLLNGKNENENMGNATISHIKNFGHKYLNGLQILLGDKDWRIQASAADAIGHIGKQAASAVPALIFALQSADWHVKSRTAQALSAIGAKAVPGLLPCLNNHDHQVRMLAVELLGEIGKNNQAVQVALLRRLGDPESDVRSLAAEALAKTGVPDNDLSRLQELLQQDEDLEVKRNALATLGKLGSGQLYLPVLQQNDWAMKKFALAQIAALNDQAATIFIEALRAPNDATKMAAAKALGAMGKKANSALPELENMANSHAVNLRSAALKSIVLIKSGK